MSAPVCHQAPSGQSAVLQRMRQRAQFDAVLACAPAAKTVHFALHCAFAQSDALPCALFPGGGRWIGVLLPKRWAKRAVTRNLMRRQVYAICQQMAATLPCGPMVVRLRRAFAVQQFPSAKSVALRQAARQELLTLFGSVRHA